MGWEIEIVLYLFLIAAAIVSLQLRDLLAATAASSVFSFIIAILYISMGAVDVGFTEAVVGAGVLGVYFVGVILMTSRKSKD